MQEPSSCFTSMRFSVSGVERRSEGGGEEGGEGDECAGAMHGVVRQASWRFGYYVRTGRSVWICRIVFDDDYLSPRFS